MTLSLIFRIIVSFILLLFSFFTLIGSSRARKWFDHKFGPRAIDRDEFKPLASLLGLFQMSALVVLVMVSVWYFDPFDIESSPFYYRFIYVAILVVSIIVAFLVSDRIAPTDDNHSGSD